MPCGMPCQPINRFIVSWAIKQELANQIFLEAGDATSITGLTPPHSGSYSKPTVRRVLYWFSGNDTILPPTHPVQQNRMRYIYNSTNYCTILIL